MIFQAIVILLLTSLLLLGLKIYKILTPSDPNIGKIPGPPALASLGGMMFSSTPAIDFIQIAYKKYGKVYRNFALRRWFINVVDVNIAKNIYQDTDTYQKPQQKKEERGKFLDLYFGDNIVNLNGEKWKRIRKVFTPAFHFDYLKGFTQTFSESAMLAIEQIENREKINDEEKQLIINGLLSEKELKEENDGEMITVDVVPLMSRLTLDVLGKCILGFDFGTLSNDKEINKRGDEYTKRYHHIMSQILNPLRFIFKFYDKMPTAGNKKLEKDIIEFTDLLQEIINERKALIETNELPEDHKDDLLDMMLAEHEGQDPLSDDELKYNMNTLYLAGHDTTSTSLSMAINLLAHHPEIQDKAREEVMEVLKDKEFPDFEDQKKLVYLNQVVKEGLRLFPPVGTLPVRVLSKDVELEGYHVPEGSWVQLDIYNIHHSEEYYDDPETFNPDRFAPGTKLSSPFAFCPFGLGKRSCIGNNFSLMEQRIFLSILLKNYELYPGPITENTKKTLNKAQPYRTFNPGKSTFLQPSDCLVRFKKIESL